MDFEEWWVNFNSCCPLNITEKEIAQWAWEAAYRQAYSDAYADAAYPIGYVLVPVEPTAKMLAIGRKTVQEADIWEVYQAMIQAAQSLHCSSKGYTMTPEESKIVQKAYEIMCREADKSDFIGKYLEFPAYGDYGLQLSKKPIAYEHKETGEIIYINCSEKLSDYSDVLNPDDYEKAGYSL